jgi:hypothetical protein
MGIISVAVFSTLFFQIGWLDLSSHDLLGLLKNLQRPNLMGRLEDHDLKFIIFQKSLIRLF